MRLKRTWSDLRFANPAPLHPFLLSVPCTHALPVSLTHHILVSIMQTWKQAQVSYEMCASPHGELGTEPEAQGLCPAAQCSIYPMVMGGTHLFIASDSLGRTQATSYLSLLCPTCQPWMYFQAFQVPSAGTTILFQELIIELVFFLLFLGYSGPPTHTFIEK